MDVRKTLLVWGLFSCMWCFLGFRRGYICLETMALLRDFLVLLFKYLAWSLTDRCLQLLHIFINLINYNCFKHTLWVKRQVHSLLLLPCLLEISFQRSYIAEAFLRLKELFCYGISSLQVTQKFLIFPSTIYWFLELVQFLGSNVGFLLLIIKESFV